MVERELQSQKKVKKWLIEDLGYRFLGNKQDQDNTAILEDVLLDNLRKRGYDDSLAKRAVREIVALTKNQQKSLYDLNKEIYSLLRYGFKAKPKPDSKPVTIQYIDWNVVENNDFSFAEEVTVRCLDERYRKRPDIVIYINGIAVCVFELKRSSVSLNEGIRQNLTNQRKENIAHFFDTIQLIFAGNESEGLNYGVIETPEKFFLNWKEDTKAEDQLSISIRELINKDNQPLRAGLISLCHKERLLEIMFHFMIYDAGVKKTCRHNQFFANIAARKAAQENRGGVIWNTQGSGKSLIMVWLTKWIIENITDSRVIIITDRDELDDQIESLFDDVDEKIVRAKSCADLRDLLNSHEARVMCSLIHKYGHDAGKQSDVDAYTEELLKALPKGFEARGNIIAFIDECHRTNSGKLHAAVKAIMPNATLIGFTGTPLLKKDKKTSIETFGPYIHTYKFDEGVEDGVILDLRYEARDVDQNLQDEDKIDTWFEIKTEGLSERAKNQLKQSWTTMNKLYSSGERLQRIAADILFDMNVKPRLRTNRGTAMLVAGSIYEACKYYEIFTAKGFNKCAVVTSYEPSQASVRTATSSLTEESEDEFKKRIYENMLAGKSVSEFEAEAKELFKKQPGKMKLLIVVDKLLTGFDAPSATYLYIDKSMRDHDLFQAICRVNRPDGEDKDYGYIVDYMDLFKSLQMAITDYTSEAFDEFDAEDVEGLIKDRYEEAKAEMVGALNSLSELLSGVPYPQSDQDYIKFFCGESEEERKEDEFTDRRDTLYTLVASATRSFASCSDRLVSHFNYDSAQVKDIRDKIREYNQLKDLIKLASCDYIELKPYEADMRFLLDTYIHAEPSQVLSSLDNMSLTELLVQRNTTTTVDQIFKSIPGDDNSRAETIENNLRHEIVRKLKTNEVYYGKMSEMLEDVIRRRKIEALTYKEYLKAVVDLANSVIHPEEAGGYPDTVKDSEAKRALYDYFNKDEPLTVAIHYAVKGAIEPGWKGYKPKQNKVKRAIHNVLVEFKYDNAEASTNQIAETNEIYDLIQKQVEYDD